MPKMGKYCKAYSLSKFRRFGNWPERDADGLDAAVADSRTAPGSEALLAEHKYLFLHENLVVTRGIFMDENVVFDQITPEWESFCRNELKFEAPAGLKD
jgi:hypothetical protein